MRLAVIPARGGSKRIPRKNIKNFHGKPIIAWTIETAISSGCFDKVIVSTDDAEISSVANQYGAETPFVRPPHLADDYTPTVPVIAHAIESVEREIGAVEFACCLYATSPFLRVEDLKRGFNQVSQSNIDYAISVTSFPFPIQRALKIDDMGRIGMFDEQFETVRSQDLEPAFHDAGQFYWGTRRAWLNKIPFFSGKSGAIVLPASRVQDIDTAEDWSRAELMFRAML